MTELMKKYLFHAETIDTGIIPYLSERDFEGLKKETFYFYNEEGKRLAYFFYSYPNYKQDKLILFLHGVGPGHKAYVREIETLAKRRYRVLTYDYAGCGESEGDGMTSLLIPARDAIRLLKEVSPTEELTVIGHSLGAFTCLMVLTLCPKLRRAVIISGFSNLEWYLSKFDEKEQLIEYERKQTKLFDLDIFACLQKTEQKILFIHSEDDQVVRFADGTGRIMEEISNPNFSYHIEKHRKHNPNYTDEALAYMGKTFGEFISLIQNGTLDTYEKQKAYMADKSAMEMTHQDEMIIQKIVDLIEA